MKTPFPLSRRQIPDMLKASIRGPLVILMGSPAEIGNLLEQLKLPDALCLQLDLHQARAVQAELAERGITARVEVVKDFWDIQHGQATVLVMAQMRGERELKIDMIDQAFHSLSTGGRILVWCPTIDDSLHPELLKRFFGKTHAHICSNSLILWAVRQDGDNRPRRRHELNFHARLGGHSSQNFISRPGVFSYGKMDDGSRALAEIARIEPGDRVLDLGCGHGTLGVFAGLSTGPKGEITFADSNARALDLAALNATNCGVTHFKTQLACESSDLIPLGENSFDVILANPPYFAGGSIALKFVDLAARMLKPGGRFYLVTRQPDELAEAMSPHFPSFDAILNRGYTVLLVDEQMSLRPIPEELHVPDENAVEEPAELPVESIEPEARIQTKHPRGTGFRRRGAGGGGGAPRGGFGKPRTSRRDNTGRDFRNSRED